LESPAVHAGEDVNLEDFVAKKVLTEFVDDIDGTVAERTFTFAVDGTDYEIDLSVDNIAEFKAAVAGFVESARKTGRPAVARRTPADRSKAGEIRQWARSNGRNVGDKGRIPEGLIQEFEAAQRAAS
jgi:hypothetical protein